MPTRRLLTGTTAAHGVLAMTAMLSWSGGHDRRPVLMPEPAETEVAVAHTPLMETVHVEVVPPPQAPDHRLGPAAAGHVVVVFETFLADLAGVVPRVQGVPTTPGLALALPPSEPPWEVTLSMAMSGDDITVGARLCNHEDVCTEHSAEGSRLNPNAPVARLVQDLSERLGRTPVVPFDVWSEPETTDAYAVLILSRAAGILQGYLPPVSAAQRWSSRRDPVARSVFIDGSMATGWVIFGRVSDDPVKWLKAYTYASQGRPESVALRAARAGALEQAGFAKQSLAAWREIDGLAPGDMRFLLPRARAFLSAGSPERARAVLAEAGHRYDDHPEVVRLRVDIADAEGQISDEVLAKWQRADQDNPEPVRRRIVNRIREGERAEALDMTAELSRRGATDEANAYRIALGSDLGRWEVAAKAADGLRDPDLSRRLLARARDGHAEQLDVLSGVRSAHGRLVRASRLVEAGQAGEAVDELTAVLETDPWWPEALELLAEAHEALGNADAAAEARDTLHHVDPYFAAAR